MECVLDNDDDAIENDHEKFADDEDDGDVTISDDYTVMQNDDWKSAQTPSSNTNKSIQFALLGGGGGSIANHLTMFLNISGHQALEPLDNNLPFESFMSKTARLNSECSNPGLQKNCIVGQKWRCFLEDGQWRKHKCKFHVS